MTNPREADDLVDFRARVAQNTFLSVLDALMTGRVGFGAELQGYVGEAAVSEVLKRLPDDWRIVSDLEIGGENVDHLAIGPAGAFSLEVKNYSGKVIATPNGL
ncbi:MAG: nuclease-related domain-containing protein [Meiothermus sp.]|nr:nuclease-related domain-containing protein [Meiothermus sp.]